MSGLLRKNANDCVIKEQWIDDELVSGLTLVFKKNKGGGCGLFITGKNLEFGNRDFGFDADGKNDGAGTGLCKDCLGGNFNS